MAEIVWTEPALADLDAIADYIALDKPAAASRFVKKLVAKAGNLAAFPEMGAFVPEMLPTRSHRQLLMPPCRIFYRHEAKAGKVWILAVTRQERLFKASWLRRHG